jgi:hypothetical protein
MITAHDYDPYATLLKISHLMMHASKKKEALELKSFLEQCDASMYEAMVNALHLNLKERGPKMNRETAQQLVLLQNTLLKEEHWSQKLNMPTIALLGQNEGLHRWALFRLLQKANLGKRVLQSASLADLDNLLIQDIMSEALNNDLALPIEHIVTLCSTKAIALEVLHCLSLQKQYFEVTLHLIMKHPSLAPLVFENWSALLEMPLPSETRKAIIEAAEQLQNPFPEFSKLIPLGKFSRVLAWMKPFDFQLVKNSLPHLLSSAVAYQIVCSVESFFVPALGSWQGAVVSYAFKSYGAHLIQPILIECAQHAQRAQESNARKRPRT